MSSCCASLTMTVGHVLIIDPPSWLLTCRTIQRQHRGSGSRPRCSTPT